MGLLGNASFFQLFTELLALGYARMTHRGPEQTSTEAAQSKNLSVLEVLTQSVFPVNKAI